MTKKIELTVEKPIVLDGLLTIQKREDGLHNIDFQCCEDAEIEPIKADFETQVMHDGNAYMQEKEKKKKKKRDDDRKTIPLYRLDESALSLGKDGDYYYSFRLPSAQARELPVRLASQAEQIAKWFLIDFLC